MPPEVRLAGLILLLICPVGLALETVPAIEIGSFSSEPPARQPDRHWVTTSRSALPLPAGSIAERLGRHVAGPGTFVFSDPVDLALDDSPENGVVPASYSAPSDSSGISPSAGSLADSPNGEDQPKRLPSAYPDLPPPDTRDPTPTGTSSGQLGDIASLVTIGGSLALVLGLFMMLAWIMRRTVPGAVGALPGDVVEVLGRAPLAGRQQVHLVRCGSKLILISVTPEGAETLTEITDPEEVDRLAGICRATHAGSATSAFRHVFGQFAGQRNDSETVVDSGELNLSGMGFVQSTSRGSGGH